MKFDLSWILLIVAVVFQTYLGTVGNLIDSGSASAGGSLTSWKIYEHGWPMVFMTRTVVNTPSSRYSLFSGQSVVHPLAAIVNALTALAAVGVVYFCVRWHVKRHKSFLRFSLCELLVGTTIIAFFASYYGWVISTTRSDSNVALDIQAMGHSCDYTYYGPRYLTRLFGDGARVEGWDVVSAISLSEGTDDREIERMFSVINKLSHVEEIDARNTLVSNTGLSRLADLRWADDVRVLTLDYSLVTDDGLSSLIHFPHLYELSLGHTLIGDGGLEFVSKCSYLSELNCSHTRITSAGLKSLSLLPDLKLVRGADLQISAAEWERFSKQTGCKVEFW